MSKELSPTWQCYWWFLYTCQLRDESPPFLGSSWFLGNTSIIIECDSYNRYSIYFSLLPTFIVSDKSMFKMTEVVLCLCFDQLSIAGLCSHENLTNWSQFSDQRPFIIYSIFWWRPALQTFWTWHSPRAWGGTRPGCWRCWWSFCPGPPSPWWK